MEESLSWEASISSACQKFAASYKTQKIHYCRLSLTYATWSKSTSLHPISLRSSFISLFHLHQGHVSVVVPSLFPYKVQCALLCTPIGHGVPPVSLFVWSPGYLVRSRNFEAPHYAFFFPSSPCFVPLGLKYLHVQSVLEKFQLVFLLSTTHQFAHP